MHAPEYWSSVALLLDEPKSSTILLSVWDITGTVRTGRREGRYKNGNETSKTTL